MRYVSLVSVGTVIAVYDQSTRSLTWFDKLSEQVRKHEVSSYPKWDVNRRRFLP
jgi:hypothetical protein